MRFAIIAAASLIATVASAAPPPSQSVGNTSAFPEIQQAPDEGFAQLYRPISVDTPQQALARLNRWCESKNRADQRRCDRAWGRINAEYARMQAERANER